MLLAGRDRTALIEAAETLAGAEVIVADATDEDGVKRIVAEAGRVDDAVVAVSAGARATSIPRTDLADAQAAFSKVWASYAMLHHAPDYIATGGLLTLLSGSSARRPGAGFGVWTAVHAAVEGFARAAAIELAPIRVNLVSPGGIGLRSDRQLIQRQGVADDVALAVIALITNPAVTGAVLDVDSGERLGAWSGDQSNEGGLGQ